MARSSLAVFFFLAVDLGGFFDFGQGFQLGFLVVARLQTYSWKGLDLLWWCTKPKFSSQHLQELLLLASPSQDSQSLEWQKVYITMYRCQNELVEKRHPICSNYSHLIRPHLKRYPMKGKVWNIMIWSEPNWWIRPLWLLFPSRCDMWSIGAMCFMLLAGIPPFVGNLKYLCKVSSCDSVQQDVVSHWQSCHAYSNS